MSGFRVKFKTKEEFINGLVSLNEIGALGKEICIGTYLPNSENVDKIISEKKSLYKEKPSDNDDIMEFSIGVASEYEIENYKHLIGKNNICVGLTTCYDIEHGDVFGKNVQYKNMIKETLKLMNI